MKKLNISDLALLNDLVIEQAKKTNNKALLFEYRALSDKLIKEACILDKELSSGESLKSLKIPTF